MHISREESSLFPKIEENLQLCYNMLFFSIPCILLHRGFNRKTTNFGGYGTQSSTISSTALQPGTKNLMEHRDSQGFYQSLKRPALLNRGQCCPSWQMNTSRMTITNIDHLLCKEVGILLWQASLKIPFLNLKMTISVHTQNIL